MKLGGARLVADTLLELDLRRVEPADDHQIAAEDLVSLRVPDIELERFRQRLDGFADFLLGEEAVAERVPAPRRFGRCFTYSARSGSTSVNLPSRMYLFELRHPPGVVRCGLVLVSFSR